MPSRAVRGLGLVAYALLLLAVFTLSAYFSFSLFVRSGATRMPDVVNLPRSEAGEALADRGLRLAKVVEPGRYDEKVPAGRVVRQNPEGGTWVKRGSGAVLVLSLGPRRVMVPVLTGRSVPEAQAAISGAGLALGHILGAFAPARTPPNQVIEQDPAPEEAAPPATAVDLLVALPEAGERYLMPDLIYRNYEIVRPSFERQGFKFGSVRFERYEGVAAGVILRQFPLPGHPVSRDDAVSLVVATADLAP
jgi:serine/threonine-protein kinase